MHRNMIYLVAVLLVMCLAVTTVAHATDAVVIYPVDTGSQKGFPRLRFWNSSGSGNWSDEIVLPDSTSSNINYALIRQAPVATKIVAAVQGGSGILTGYVCMSDCDDNNSWVVSPNLATLSPSTRDFDITFDDQGNAFIVYGYPTGGASQELAYRVLPMPETNFSNMTEYYIDDINESGGVNYKWVRMDPNPQKTEVIMTAQQDGYINAWVWNGNAWGNQTEMSNNAPSADTENLALRYALGDNICMVLAAHNAAGTVNYRYWDGSSWSSLASFNVNSSAAVDWINMESDPQTDDFQAVIVDNNRDLHTAYWNGSSWNVTSNIATLDPGGRAVDFDWETTGSIGRLVWDEDGNGDTLSQLECAPQCTGTPTTIANYTRGGNFITIIRNPTTTDQTKLLGVRLNSQNDLGSFSFNGTDYDNYGDDVITDSGVKGYEVQSIFFQLSTVIPVISCPVITSSGSYKVFTNLYGAPNNASPLNDTVCVKIAASDVIFDCNGYSITNNGTSPTTYGVLLNGSVTNVTLRNCPSISQYSIGVMVYQSDDNVITNVTAYNNTLEGFVLDSSSNNNLTNNVADYTNSGFGFLLANSNFNTLTNNTAYDSNSQGFVLGTSSHNTLTNNTAYNNGDGFFLFSNSENNTLTNNTAYNNSAYGFYLGNSSDNVLTDNTAYDNVQTGIFVSISDNSQISGCHLYNNGRDLRVTNLAVPKTLNLSNVIFDNPAGGYDDYTNLSLADSSADSYYFINWSSQPTLPPGYSSFEEKFVNIDNLTSGAVSIDTIVWHWLDSESATYNESKFVLAKYNTSWAFLNSTPDTVSNTLSLFNVNPLSIYGILMNGTPPNVTLVSPANSSFINSSTVNFTFNVTDDVDTSLNCSIYLDGVLNQTNSSTQNGTNTVFTISGISDSLHNWSVTCTDSGSFIDTSVTWFFTVDTAPPAVTIQSPANLTYNTTTIDLNYTATDTNLDSCWYDINGTGPNNLTNCTNITLSSLAEGPNNVTVYANDTAGNTGSATVYFTVDTTPPSIIIYSPTNSTYNSTVPLTYAASDPNLDKCAVFLNGFQLPIFNCSNSSLGLADGSYNLTIVVNDTAGNTNSSTVIFTVDQTPPSITIQSPTNSTYNTSTIDLNYTVSDNFAVDTCWYSLDGGATSNLTGCVNITLSSLSEGAHNVTVYVNDTAGNTNSSTVYFTVDTLAPTLTIYSPTNSTYNVSTIDLNYTTSNVNIDTCWYVRDGGAPIELGGCVNGSLGGLSEGAHNVTVYANDTAGNTNSSTVYFTVDTIPPSVSIQSPTNSTYNTSTPDLNYTVSDPNLDKCWYDLDGTIYPLPSCNNITLPGPLSEGAHNVTVYANDTAGNTNSSTVYFTVDTILPVVTIYSPTNSTYNVSTIALDYTAVNGNLDTCWYVRDGGAPIEMGGCVNGSLIGLSEGAHNVTVYANDTANNIGSDTVYFTVDLTAPTITIQSPTNSTYGTPDVPLNFTATDNFAVDTCWYYLDGAGPTMGCANDTLSSLLDGPHNVTVYANDTAGNTNSTTVYFTVDTTLPVVTIISPTNSTYAVSTVPLDYTTSNVNLDSCWYDLDGTGPTDLLGCNNITMPFVADGGHNVTVYANDTAGNVGSSATVYFTVDTAPPVVTLVSPTNTTYTTSSVDLDYIVTDNIAVGFCWYVLDGGAPTDLPGCANTSIGPMPNGGHNITVYANDTAGNVGSSATEYFTINAPSPPPPPDGDGKKRKKSLDVEWEQICPGDLLVFNVTHKDEPVPNVEVRLILYETFGLAQLVIGGLVAEIETDEDGLAAFEMPDNGTYRVYFHSDNYRYQEEPIVIEYSLCEEIPECTSDSDCSDSQYCDEEGECQDVECECGYVENHECISYECCEDGDCAEGYVCEGNECVLAPECQTDEDCEDAEYCADGYCEPVPEEECGYVANHAWHDYECCDDEDCDDYPYEKCSDHECVQNEYGIENLTALIVDREGIFAVFEDEERMPGVDVEIESPSGRVIERTTDGNGEFTFVPDEEGMYEIRAYGEDGRLLASMSVPSGVISVCCLWFLCNFFGFIEFLSICWYWWVLLILIIITAILLYYYYQKFEKKKKYTPRGKK